MIDRTLRTPKYMLILICSVHALTCMSVGHCELCNI